jgi:hypothetical protein
MHALSAIADDIPAFLQDFGVSGTVAGLPVVGLFDNAYAQAAIGMVGLGGTRYAYTCSSLQLPADPIGASVTIPDVLSNWQQYFCSPPHAGFVVVDSEPDGTGLTLLHLEVAAP